MIRYKNCKNDSTFYRFFPVKKVFFLFYGHNSKAKITFQKKLKYGSI